MQNLTIASLTVTATEAADEVEAVAVVMDRRTERIVGQNNVIVQIALVAQGLLVSASSPPWATKCIISGNLVLGVARKEMVGKLQNG